jgi:transmembrane sensor
MDYSRYQVEDFVTDEYFIKWVKTPTEESNAFWTAWLSINPERRSRVQEAREIILLLDIKDNPAPEGRLLDIWENIIREDQRIGYIAEEKAKSFSSHRQLKWYHAVAASLVFITLIGAALFWHQNRAINIVTAYGESRTLFLPDSTKVTLNSNSSIHFSASNFRNKKREVWLEGEAFFAVVHKNDHQNFLVHTDELHVEVLGTKFDVNSRRGKTRVVLEEGRVKLNLRSPDSEPFIMKPGELVEFTETDPQPKKKIVDPDNYLSWKNNRLIFVSTSLLDIAHLLEDNYGYHVTFADEELDSRKFTGSASSDNVEELLQKLSIVFGLDIQKDNKNLIIQYEKENPKQPSRP